MPIDPYLEPLLAALPAVELPADGDWPRWREEGRLASNALMSQVGEPGPPVEERRTLSIPGDVGQLDVRVYRPAATGPLPIHLFLHGGGWMAGGIDFDFVDAACRERAVEADCVVIALNYRKAPEHPFPAALDDCAAAMSWIVEHAEEIGGRADVVTVGGQSAGANLAAALCLRLRDEGAPMPVFQLLEVPALDLSFTSPSIATYGSGFGLDRDGLDDCVRLYAPDPALIGSPYVSPLLCDDLTGLPPAHVMSSECDPLRDDGVRYVKRLTNAGVDATYYMGTGHIHGSSTFTKVMESARAWRSNALASLRKAHQQSSV